MITQKDFIDSLRRNQVFWNELERYALDNSIIFIGFNAHATENNHILSTIFEAQQELVRNFRQPYSPFAILPKVDAETSENIENIGINLLEGTLEEFSDAILAIKNVGSHPTIFRENLKDKITIKTSKNEFSILRSELYEYNKQFFFYNDKFFEEQKEKFDALIPEKKIDAWKSQPSFPFIYGGNWAARTQFSEAFKMIMDLVKEVGEKKSPRLFLLGGKRASGKTMFVHQLAYKIYKSANNPILFLNSKANYVEHSQNSHNEYEISGWNNRIFDKFLSLFHNEGSKSSDHVPVIIADHVSYRQNTLDSLVKSLDNHGKPILLVLTLNEDDLNEEVEAINLEKSLKLSQLYRNKHFLLNHKLDDNEIDSLFSVISKDFRNISLNKDFLLSRAKDIKEANRDILLILYQWFDKNFRKLEEIIIEESGKITENNSLKKLYLAIAAFYRYNIKPPIKACIDASEIDIQAYKNLKGSPHFKSLIDVSLNDVLNEDEYAFSRHPEYSRQIFDHLCPEKTTQNDIINSVLANCSGRDLLFVRAFFNYLYEIDVAHTVHEVTKFKEATEIHAYLNSDLILNHQFGAYLIRENSNLEDARYYLDLALQEDPENPAFLHSIGNLHYRIFKNLLSEKKEPEAKNHYELAKSYFERNRALRKFPDEHGYVTDIIMTRYRRDNSQLIDREEKVLLNAESEGLFLEALRVVPKENQNYLLTVCNSGRKFKELPLEDREILLNKIHSGKASSTLIQYYSKDLLESPKNENWVNLEKMVSNYFDSEDINILIPISIISKKAFIKSAENRFERLRGYFDNLVRYREEKISFVLLSEYVKLLIIDAFVLGKFKFIPQIMSDIRNKLFIRTFPRFLSDEYILEKSFYQFDESDTEKLKQLFMNHSNDFSRGESAEYFDRIVSIGSLDENFVRIEIDPVTRFWVKAIRKEIATGSSKTLLRFKVKYSWDGLKATDFIG